VNGMYKASRVSTSFQKKQPPTSRLLILGLTIGCYLKKLMDTDLNLPQKVESLMMMCLL
jgi:hypothetical protein